MSRRPVKVVILGAGAAGIGAAAKLLSSENDANGEVEEGKNSGGAIEVIVLEARERLGGRVKRSLLTQNLRERGEGGDGESEGIQIQLGANWVHGLCAENPIFKAAVDMDLRFQVTSSDDEPGGDVILFDFDATKVEVTDDGNVDIGDENISMSANDTASIPPVSRLSIMKTKKKPIDFSELSPILHRYQWIRQQIGYCRESLELLQHIDDNYLKRKSFKETFDSYVVKSEEIFGPSTAIEQRCFNWLLDRMSIDYACSIDDLALYADLEGESDGAHGEGVVKAGIDTILHAIAGRHSLSDKIHFNHVVREVSVAEEEEEDSRDNSKNNESSDKRTRVNITCENGRTIDADYCIVALPLGVLQSSSITFSPPNQVPLHIHEITSSLSSGLMNLVWLWFPHIFWPTGYNFLAHTRQACDPNEFSTFLVPEIFDKHGNQQAVLMAQTVDAFALELEDMTDEAIAGRATAILRRLFDDVPDPIGCAHSAWKSDPFSQGSWSYWDKDKDSRAAAFRGSESDQDAPNLQERIFEKNSVPQQSLLFFAGEYLNSEHRGTVHGAYISGQEAADEVLARLSQSSDC